MHSDDVPKARSPRESGVTSRSTTAFNSREGSSGADGNDNMAAKLSAAEIAAIAAEKVSTKTVGKRISQKLGTFAIKFQVGNLEALRLFQLVLNTFYLGRL